jgi:O-antigen ligase
VSSVLATQPEPKPVVKATRPLLTNGALLMSAGAVLLLGPLAFGAVEPWSIFALEAGAVAVLSLWAFRQWNSREINLLEQPIYRPMAAFFALLLLQWVIGTAYRQVTYSHLLLYAAYGMLAFVVTQTLRRSSQFEMLAKLFTGYGALLASFAILQGMAPNGKIYWLLTAQQGGSIYGPYVNRNHYAGLMEMLLPFPMVLAATQFTNGSRKMVVAGIAALMAASIFLSGSRGGMIAFAAEIVVLAILLVRKRDGSWKQPLMLGMFLALVVIFLVWLGGNEVTRRLISIHSEAREEINGGVRLSIDRDCLRMLIKRPILGWGLGTFPIVYPEFRSFYTTFFVNQAHNDYLQLLVETGLVGFSIAIWFLVVMFRQASGKLKNWTETASGALTVSALLGCIGILVHSFLDFNLQIPANAALFYVLCALAASAPIQESLRKRVLRRHNLIVQPNLEPDAS